MSEFIIKRIPSLILVLLITLPNLLLLALPPKNIPKEAAQSGTLWFLLNIAERIGQVGIFTIPLFYCLKLSSTMDKIAFVGMILSLALYYIAWARFFLGRDYALLFSPLLFISIPLALAPILYFVLSALVLRSVPLLTAAVLFAVGHIPISFLEFIRSK